MIPPWLMDLLEDDYIAPAEIARMDMQGESTPHSSPIAGIKALVASKEITVFKCVDGQDIRLSVDDALSELDLPATWDPYAPRDADHDYWLGCSDSDTTN